MWRFEAERTAPVAKWLSGPAAGLGAALQPAGSADETDLYVDTDDRFFHRAGCVLRVRRSGDGVRAAMVPLHGHDEPDWVPVPSEDPEDLKGAPEPLGGRVRAVAGPRSLRATVLMRIRRRRFLLRFHGRECGELEEEEIEGRRAGEASSSVHVRVSITASEPHDTGVRGFAAAMESACGLSRAEGTAYGSVLARLGIGDPASRVVGPVSASAAEPIGALAYAVLRRQLSAFLHNEAGTRLGDDPEALHDMRVASRRLRAALALYEEVLPARSRSFRRRLGRVGRALGEVRDLDVHLEQLGEFVRDAPEAERLGMQSYLSTVAGRRGRARGRLLRVLDSKGYARLVESFLGFVEREPSRRNPAARRHALAAAPDLIVRRYRKAVKIGDDLTAASPPCDWHALRIALKRLRYALEFHAALYGEEARRVIEALQGLQDLLGLHQDAQIAMAHLETMFGPKGRRLARGTAFAMGRVAQRYAQRAEALRGRFPSLYRRIRGGRWRKLREAMDAARLPA